MYTKSTDFYLTGLTAILSLSTAEILQRTGWYQRRLSLLAEDELGNRDEIETITRSLRVQQKDSV